jgi:hypothetical protein
MINHAVPGIPKKGHVLKNYKIISEISFRDNFSRGLLMDEAGQPTFPNLDFRKKILKFQNI